MKRLSLALILLITPAAAQDAPRTISVPVQVVDDLAFCLMNGCPYRQNRALAEQLTAAFQAEAAKQRKAEEPPKP